jgi:hypothetical protein
MAEEGAAFQQILSHYYPNTMIVSWPGVVRKGNLTQAPLRCSTVGRGNEE